MLKQRRRSGCRRAKRDGKQPVMPAKAGIHADSAPGKDSAWAPAFAGATEGSLNCRNTLKRRLARRVAPPRLVAGRGAAQALHLGGILAQPRILRLELAHPNILVAVAALPLAARHQEHAEHQAEQEEQADEGPLVRGESGHEILRRW